MIANVRYVIEAIWLTVAAVWILTLFRLKPNIQVSHSGSRIVEVIVLASGAILMFSDTPRIHALEARYLPATVVFADAGIVLAALGAAFAIVARLFLGQNWSLAPRIKLDHELVRRGPYCLVRHPIYTGTIIALIGTAIAFGRMRDLAALPLLISGLWLKARSEERLLLSNFGDRYEAYRREVRGAIIPYLL